MKRLNIGGKEDKNNKDKKTQDSSNEARKVIKKVLKSVQQLLTAILMPFILLLVVAAVVIGIVDAAADAVASVFEGDSGINVSEHVSYADDGAIQIDDASIDTIINSLYEAGTDPEDLGLLGDITSATTDEEYREALRKYIREYYIAQVTTETLNRNHTESTEDAAYGSIYVYRANGDNASEDRQNLTYISYEQMQEYIDSGNQEALNYFSVNESGELVVAGYTQVTVEKGSSTDNMSAVPEEGSLTITTKSIDYRTAVSQYTTKLTFLFDLVLISQNPEFVSAFVDLINDSRIEVTIVDSVSTTVHTEQYTYTQNRKWVETLPPQANSIDSEPQTVVRRDSEQITEVTRTTTVTTTPSFQITRAKTWFGDQSISYTKKTNGPNGGEPVTENLDDDQEPTADEGEWKTGQSITTTDTITTESYEEGVNTGFSFNVGEKGDAEKLENGEISEPTFVGLMETGFKIPNTNTYENAGIKLMEGSDILFYLLQKDQSLQNMETLMRYALYKYSGQSFGVTELDSSLFEIQGFSTVSLGSSSLLKQYIRYWEHSSPPPTNADGTKYIIETGSAGEPVVGYGIDINTHGQEFINAGYSIEIGAEVDVEFVDAIEDRIREEYYNQIKNITAGLNLTEYQLHALTSRAYNCGVGGALTTLRGSPTMNFVNSYNTYWNDDTDNQFEEKNNNANFNHSLYTQYMSKPVTALNPTTGQYEYLSGLERRRRSEWTLFQTGYYAELNQWYTGAGDILSAADQLHQAQTGWRYSTSGGLLTSGNIELAINNPNAATCCATYVSSALYLAGCFTEEQMNSFNYNSSNALYNFLTSNGWQVINSSGELQAGDVVFMDTNGGARDITHVQIYAGDGGWYNAGSDSAIQGDAPKYYDIGSQFMVALRQN